MNTSFLKVLATSQRKAQVVGQILCLMVVAAIFVVSPFVSLAACGRGGGAQDEVKKTLKNSANQTGTNVNIVATVDSFIAGTADPNAMNKSAISSQNLPAGNQIDGHVVLKGLTGTPKIGDWIVIEQKGIATAATFFGCNNQGVCELWDAETNAASQDSSSKTTGGKVTAASTVGRKIFVNKQNLIGAPVTA